MRKLFFLSCTAALLFTVCIVVGARVSAQSTTTFTQYIPVIAHNPCPPFSKNEVVAAQYHHENMQNDDVWPCLSTGQNVVVAVLDTGVDKDHFDLAANLLPGRSFEADASKYKDDNGHGTHVAGIVAAVANNGGVIGTAPHAKILPVKVLGDRGGDARTIAFGIYWAVDNGADIINLSLGGRHTSGSMEAAIAYADARDVLIIAASGNCGDPINWERQGCKYRNVASYPASYPSVMAIGSTDDNPANTISVYSTQAYVDAVVPGRNILSTWREGGHATISGTSMASPNAAGIAALLMSRYPNLTAQQVRFTMDNAAIDLGPAGYDNAYGFGFLNARHIIAAIESNSVTLSADTLTPLDIIAQHNVAPSPSLDELTPDEYIAGDVIVGLGENVKIESLLQSAASRSAIELRVVSADTAHNLYQLAVPSGKELEMIDILRNTKGVLYAEPNFIFEAY